MLNLNAGSPFADIRVRKAINPRIDREAIATMLGGFGKPAMGHGAARPSLVRQSQLPHPP
ncbi:hypothetical protein KPL78_26895 [Roseomonas sp. HJA6]|uniref:Uncharacterized protein n=1 Tax=Roseomonas alba TaxID=2846776 RepID=A0ABS7AGS8_9PROT|nr:hypothetical protein [Neoroseomonas alba]MBW6401508.1 hypothetical protein [Neoroseomonas alba]